MVKKYFFSNEHLDLSDISLHHSDSEISLRKYFLNARKYPERFSAYTNDEIHSELGKKIHKLNPQSFLSLLAAIEAVLRIDYLQRNSKNKKTLFLSHVRTSTKKNRQKHHWKMIF